MPLLRRTFHAMASRNELQLWCDELRDGERVADAAIADVFRIEAKYSRYRDDSVTSRINQHAGGSDVAIDAETAALLRYADQCWTLSGGRFDVTSGVLRRIWDFRRQPPRLPGEHEIAAATSLIGWPDVAWSDHTIRLPRPGMEIDFGGIGKEYAADRMATICADCGCAHALINLGGDVRAVGAQYDGVPWQVGIRHPRRDDAVVATFALQDGAIATSGDYQRFFDLAGLRYCHIMNARTGQPVRHWQSISVVAPLCVVAGSCATIGMLLESEGESFIAAQGLAYLAIDGDGVVHRPADGERCQPAQHNASACVQIAEHEPPVREHDMK